MHNAFFGRSHKSFIAQRPHDSFNGQGPHELTIGTDWYLTARLTYHLSCSYLKEQMLKK